MQLVKLSLIILGYSRLSLLSMWIVSRLFSLTIPTSRSLNPVVGIFEKAFSRLVVHSQANCHLLGIFFSSDKVPSWGEVRSSTGQYALNNMAACGDVTGVTLVISAIWIRRFGYSAVLILLNALSSGKVTSVRPIDWCRCTDYGRSHRLLLSTVVMSLTVTPLSPSGTHLCR